MVWFWSFYIQWIVCFTEVGVQTIKTQVFFFSFEWKSKTVWQTQMPTLQKSLLKHGQDYKPHPPFFLFKFTWGFCTVEKRNQNPFLHNSQGRKRNKMITKIFFEVKFVKHHFIRHLLNDISKSRVTFLMQMFTLRKNESG